MDGITPLIQELQLASLDLPFYVYSSTYEQNILNIPVAKPLLIFVINGEKKIGKGFELTCHAGSFIFLSDNNSVHMRNIPNKKKYVAILIEFDHHDFEGLPTSYSSPKIDYFMGKTTDKIEQYLKQLIEISAWAPQSIFSLRKKEILMLLYHLGYQDVLSMMGRPQVSHKIHDLLIKSDFHEVTTDKICAKLAMSQSTLRRKLKSENTSIKEIKDKARLGLGLHLLQTTEQSINTIAEQCGYQSQSRFTQNFKQRFGLTPTELRKTKRPA